MAKIHFAGQIRIASIVAHHGVVTRSSIFPRRPDLTSASHPFVRFRSIDIRSTITETSTFLFSLFPVRGRSRSFQTCCHRGCQRAHLSYSSGSLLCGGSCPGRGGSAHSRDQGCATKRRQRRILEEQSRRRRAAATIHRRTESDRGVHVRDGCCRRPFQHNHPGPADCWAADKYTWRWRYGRTSIGLKTKTNRVR